MLEYTAPWASNATCRFCRKDKNLLEVKLGKNGDYASVFNICDSCLEELKNELNNIKKSNEFSNKKEIVPKNLLEYVISKLSSIYEFKNIKETNPKWKMDVYKDGELVMKSFEIQKAIAMNQQDAIVRQAQELFEKSIIVNKMMKNEQQ